MKNLYLTTILAIACAISIFAAEPTNVVFTYDETSTIKSRSVETEIRTQPAGKVYENMSRSCMSYGDVLGQPHLFTIDASLSKIVEGDDGALYVYNPIWSFSTQTWMKLEKGEGDNYVLKTPHLIYTETDTYDDEVYEIKYYLRRLVQKTLDDGSISLGFDKTSSDINFTWQNGVLTMEEGCLMGVIDDLNTWNYSADYNVVISTVTDELITLDPADTQSYFMSYYDDYGQPQAAIMNVKIDGETIYMGNFPDAGENTFIKGTLKNGKATFPSKQYVGPSKTKDYNMYFSGASTERTWDEEEEQWVEVAVMSENFVFTYDDATGALSSTGVFFINPGKKMTGEQTTILSEPAMEPWVEVATTPADPVITNMFRATEESYNWGWIDFDLPITDVNGVIMNPNKLFYNIYLDENVYTLTSENYPSFEKPTTDIPYLFNSFTDGIFATGQEHSFMFQFNNFERMGVQSIYHGGGEIRKSNIVYTEYDSVEELDTEKAVESITYTDLAGRSVSSPVSGIYIKTTRYTDGTIRTTKVAAK